MSKTEADDRRARWPALQTLDDAARMWVGRGRSGPLARWFERELDPEGIPKRLEVPAWMQALEVIAAARDARVDDWPESLDALLEGWFRALLRFSRPDGTPAFGQGAGVADVAGFLRGWVERLVEPGFATVVDWWFPSARRQRHAPPPLPADARPDRPLALLRANWARDGDFLAIDHREAGMESRLEVFAHGQPWLGPVWSSGDPEGRAGQARPRLWSTQSLADMAEWSFRVGQARVTRTAILFRGRRLALLGEQWDGPGDPGGWQLSLADGVEATPLNESQGLALRTRPGRTVLRVLPVGLPASAVVDQAGHLSCQNGMLVLDQPAAGRRTWRPLLLSWDAQRDRVEPRWQALTVTANRRVCDRAEAFAVRLSWRRNESLLIYRSLGAPLTRAFLGHQTRLRFLAGLFNKEGGVEPLVTVD